MKTPSISKKNRAGSPSPQPSGVSEPWGRRGRWGPWSHRGTRGCLCWGGRAGRAARGGLTQLRPRQAHCGGHAGPARPRRSARGRRPRGGHGLPHRAPGAGWRCQGAGNICWWALEDGAQDWGALVLLGAGAVAQRSSSQGPGVQGLRGPAGVRSFVAFVGPGGAPGLDRGVFTRDQVRLPQPEVGYRVWDPLLARPPPPGSGVPAHPTGPAPGCGLGRRCL